MKKGHVKLLPPPARGGDAYVHHVRSASTHVWLRIDVPPHTSYNAWCGQTIFTGGRRPNRPCREAEFFIVPPRNAIVCATCEGRAIGAGLDKSRRVHGHVLSFRPRV